MALLIFHFDAGGSAMMFVRMASASALALAASSWVMMPFFTSRSRVGSEASAQEPSFTAQTDKIAAKRQSHWVKRPGTMKRKMAEGRQRVKRRKAEKEAEGEAEEDCGS